MVHSQPFLLNKVKIQCFCIFDTEKVPDELFLECFRDMAKVSKENGFHENLAAK